MHIPTLRYVTYNTLIAYTQPESKIFRSLTNFSRKDNVTFSIMKFMKIVFGIPLIQLFVFMILFFHCVRVEALPGVGSHSLSRRVDRVKRTAAGFGNPLSALGVSFEKWSLGDSVINKEYLKGSREKRDVADDEESKKFITEFLRDNDLTATVSKSQPRRLTSNSLRLLSYKLANKKSDDVKKILRKYKSVENSSVMFNFTAVELKEFHIALLHTGETICPDMKRFRILISAVEDSVRQRIQVAELNLPKYSETRPFKVNDLIHTINKCGRYYSSKQVTPVVTQPPYSISARLNIPEITYDDDSEDIPELTQLDVVPNEINMIHFEDSILNVVERMCTGINSIQPLQSIALTIKKIIESHKFISPLMRKPTLHQSEMNELNEIVLKCLDEEISTTNKA